jgi:hypothetical protein
VSILTRPRLLSCVLCQRPIHRAQRPHVRASAHAACAADAGLWTPDCRHCLDDPPAGHTCPSCSRRTVAAS